MAPTAPTSPFRRNTSRPTRRGRGRSRRTAGIRSQLLARLRAAEATLDQATATGDQHDIWQAAEALDVAYATYRQAA